MRLDTKRCVEGHFCVTRLKTELRARGRVIFLFLPGIEELLRV